MNRRAFFALLGSVTLIPRELWRRARQRIWRAPDTASFQSALRQVQSGDVIVLSAGTWYDTTPTELLDALPNRVMIVTDAVLQ